MKTLLGAVLALSLVGNFVGAYLVLQRSPRSADNDPAAAAPSSSAAQARTDSASVATASDGVTGLLARGDLWPALYTGEDIPSLVKRLKSAGFPPKVIRAILQQLMEEQKSATREPRPYWKSAHTVKEREAMLAEHRERQTLLESLLGPEARPSALMDTHTRDRRYGNLSGDKIDALTKLERDYEEVMNLVMAERFGRPMTPEESRRYAEERALVEREKQADLAKILTPAELEQYELRNSPTASRLINQILRNVEVNEQEYTSLYRLQKAFDEKFAQGASATLDSFRVRQAAQLALNDEVRTVLSDDRFYDYLASDFQFNQAREFTQAYPTITRAATYELYRLQQQLQTASATFAQNQPLTPTQRGEQMRAMIAEYAPKVSALLGPEAFEAYKKTPQGRMFATPTGNTGPGRP